MVVVVVLLLLLLLLPFLSLVFGAVDDVVSIVALLVIAWKILSINFQNFLPPSME